MSAKPHTRPGTRHLARNERIVGDTMVLMGCCVGRCAWWAGSKVNQTGNHMFGETVAEHAGRAVEGKKWVL